MYKGGNVILPLILLLEMSDRITITIISSEGIYAYKKQVPIRSRCRDRCKLGPIYVNTPTAVPFYDYL